MKRLCACGNLVEKGELCPCQIERRQAQAKAADAKRPSARERGYNKEWGVAAKRFLALPGNGLCACGCGRVANCVDHKRPPKGDMRMFWDPANWQPMNIACNSRKNVRREGGFGNAPKR